jgi:hypothetical protein
METSSNLFDKTVQFLAEHEESLRIKKLIFCLSKKYWENNTQVLDDFPLESLIEELIQLKPTAKSLTISIYNLVRNLNHSQVYIKLARVIIEQLTQLYGCLEVDNNLDFKEENNAKFPENSADDLLDEIVTNLETHQESDRIKKLIFSVWKKQWESEIEVIDNYGIRNIILEIIQSNSTKEQLQKSLSKIVDNLNKPGVYISICRIILNQLEVMYNLKNQKDLITNTSKGEIISSQIIHITESSHFLDSRQQDLNNAIIDVDAEPSITEIKAVNINPPEAPDKPYDIFDLRMEIMQYTNPLRAKILLFSLLECSWEKSEQDWSMLRTYSLDDLLEQLILSGQSLPEIEMNLYETAQSSTDSEANSQTARIIVEVIKPLL